MKTLLSHLIAARKNRPKRRAAKGRDSFASPVAVSIASAQCAIACAASILPHAAVESPFRFFTRSENNARREGSHIVAAITSRAFLHPRGWFRR